MNHNLKKGFTFTEVMVGTIIMSMILGAVLAYVQYAGNIWKKGSEKIAAQNYSRMAFELIKQDLLDANSVSIPKKERSSDKLIYTKSDGIKYKIIATNSTNISGILVRTSKDSTTSIDYTMRLARNVNLFRVNRISDRTFEIALQIKKEQTEEEIEEGEEIEILSSDSMILIAPGL